MQVIIYSLPSLLNVAALLFLIFFIFSILANRLFGKYREGEILNDYVNFSDFHKAFLLLFSASTGEDWHVLMFDCIKNSGGYSPVIFFVFFIVITQFIMLNLFIMVILQQFEDNFFSTDNALSNFELYEYNFKTIWTLYSKKYGGKRIKENVLVDYYLDLEAPLGLGLENEMAIRESQLKELNMAEEGFIDKEDDKQFKYFVRKGLL